MATLKPLATTVKILTLLPLPTLILLSLAFLAFEARTATADTGALMTREFLASPYSVQVRPYPMRTTPGHQLLIITLLDEKSRQIVPDSKVRIQTHNVTTNESGWALALNSPANPESFMATLNLDTHGEWNFALDITGPKGKVLLQLPDSEISNVERSFAGHLVYALVLGAISLGALHIWRRSKQLKRAR